MTDPNDLDPADLRALDHLRERLAMPRGDLAAIRAILDRTGDYNGTLPDRVQKLVNDWQTGGRALIRISALVMAGENEPAADAVDRYVSTTRQQIAGWMKVTEAVDTALTPSGTMYDLTVTLADRVVELRRERDNLRTERAQVREMLDGAGITSDTVPAAVAMLIKERAEWRARMPAGPDVGTQVMADIAYACAARRQHRTDADDDRHTQREWVKGVTAYLADANEPLALVSESRAALVAAAATLVAALESMDRRAARARDEMAAAAPDVAPGGVEWRGSGHGRTLYIGDKYAGHYFEIGCDWGVTVAGGGGATGLPNEAAARAVLLALAGQECGRVVFGLREDAPIGDLLEARRNGLAQIVSDLVVLGAMPQTNDPIDVRAWVAHGQAVLTISVSE